MAQIETTSQRDRHEPKLSFVEPKELLNLGPIGEPIDILPPETETNDWEEAAFHSMGRALSQDHSASTESFENIRCLSDLSCYLHYSTTVDIQNSDFDKVFETGRFVGQIVVDLGCAHGTSAFLFANAFKARAYIGVDRFADLQLLRKRIKGKDTGEQGLEPMSVAVQTADMLTFLRSVPDRSISVITGGIDRNIIPSAEKRALITAEIERCLHPEGCWLSWASHFVIPSDSLLKKVYASRFSGDLTGQFVLQSDL